MPQKGPRICCRRFRKLQNNKLSILSKIRKGKGMVIEVNNSSIGDETIWCPYTDSVLPISKTNLEHIIPLSLGGLNSFTIRVDREFNSLLGSEVDGGLANDFLTLFRRRDFKARGHSKKNPFPSSKIAQLEDSGRPIQVSFPTAGLEIWDPIEKRRLDLGRSEETRFNATFRMDIDARLRFAAKVALSAGYLLYKDFFRFHVKHRDLRLLLEIGGKPDDRVDESITLRMYDQFSEVSEEDQLNNTIVRGLCSAVNGSSVVFGHGPSNLVISVGILGKYIGSLNVEAEISALDMPNGYDWGQAVFLQDGQVQHGTLRSAILLLAKKLGVPDLPAGADCM
jgi:hypothetical protein